MSDRPVSRLALLLRGAAILIAVLAVIDPGVTTMRRARPLVSVVAADPSRDSVLQASVAQRLRRSFTVVEAPLSATSATVVVGAQIPHRLHALTSPTFVVTPGVSREHLALRDLQAPAQVALDGRVNVTVTILRSARDVQASDTLPIVAELAYVAVPPAGDGGDTSRVNASVAGDGDSGVARVVAREHTTLRGAARATLTLTFTPPREGLARLAVRAAAVGSGDTTRHDLAIDVRRRRWSVLFFDRRPSWMSTFVRRALLRDPRFVVTSRIETSSDVSRETGRAPSGLDAVAATAVFDAVVIGAPDALRARDVDGIRTILREHGASVLMLADNPRAGPADALLSFGGWRTTPRRTPAEIVRVRAEAGVDGDTIRALNPDALTLRGVAVGTATRARADATPIAVLQADTSAGAVIWRQPEGRGQVFMSGAFDAWRYRDSAQSTFDATFRDLVEQAAAHRQPMLDLQVSRRLLSPGEPVEVLIAPRGDRSEAPRVVLRPHLVETGSVDATRAIPLWPLAPSAGEQRYRAEFRAPERHAAFDLVVTQGADSAVVGILVAPDVRRDADDDGSLLDVWAAARGGQVFAAGELAALSNAVVSAVSPPQLATRWFPMRSAWWIVPFALLLSAEWWLRRKRGLA